MKKPDSLRAAIVARFPDLETDPDKLAVYIDRGRIAARGAPARGFEWRYRLNMLLMDFRGDPDDVMAVIVDWISINQVDLLQNHQNGNEAIAFDADIIDAETIDLSIQLELDEAVQFAAGGEATHADYPQLVDAIEGVPAGTTLGTFLLGGVPIIGGG